MNSQRQHLAASLLMAALLQAPSVGRAADIDDHRRRCMVHDHRPLQVRRMPMTPATTSKPRNPLEDELVHFDTLAPKITNAPSKAQRQ